MKLIKPLGASGGRRKIIAVSLAVCAALTVTTPLTAPAQARVDQDKKVPMQTMLTPSTSCESLIGFAVSASAIALPTSGATITSATLKPSTPEFVETDAVTQALPEYCEVSGSIHPVDPDAPPINFQVKIPTRWNQMTVQIGGGGLNGSIPRSLTSNSIPTGSAMPPDADLPMSDGYAMYGGDSGHQEPGTNASWALNDEAWENFGHASLKKTHDTAFAVIRTLYGKKPKVSYFAGHSQGGREALEVAQRYPKDYDGIVATAPLIGYTAHVIHKTLLATVQTGPGWISPAKYDVVAAEVMRQCDALDGLDDGVIDNYLDCDAQFDPLKVAQPFAAVRCPDGVDATDDCVSDAQIATLNQMHAPTKFGEELANGWTEFPGYGLGREAFPGWLTVNPQPDASTQPALGQPGATLSYGILKDPAFNLVNFETTRFTTQIRAASEVIDSTNTDLSAFFAHGGRLIIKTQSSDYSSNPHTVMSYYDKLVARFGQSKVDRHVRLYVLPNGNHGGEGQSTVTGEPIPQYVDLFRMSTNWVENDKTPPNEPVLSTQLTLLPYTTLATKPMCRYPAYPRYVGGNTKSADAYRCVAN